MRALVSTRLLALVGMIMFFAFTGGIVADSIVDVTHGCADQSSQQTGGDSGCAICTICCHGTLAPPVDTDLVALVVEVISSRVSVSNESVPDGLCVRIDHPPQLA